MRVIWRQQNETLPRLNISRLNIVNVQVAKNQKSDRTVLLIELLGGGNEYLMFTGTEAEQDKANTVLAELKKKPSEDIALESLESL